MSSTVVTVGNDNPQMQVGDKSVAAEHLNSTVTRIELRDDFANLDEVALALTTNNDRMLTMIARTIGKANQKYAIGVAEIESIVSTHLGGSVPKWIDSNDPELAAVLGDYFQCHVGEPTALLTNGGRDALHAQHLSTSAQPASANYMAVSASVAAASAANTTLPGEITTAGGGLLRAQATYAHSAGTNTTTLTKTFTGNGSDSYPVTIAKIGIFNAASAGTLVYETLLNATATLTVSGDNVTITETVTAG